MALIAIEEHWNLSELTAAVKALPEDRGDASVVFDEIGDNLERLGDIGDIGDARIAAMDTQGVDLQIISLAPPGTQPLKPADARALSRRANDIAAEAVGRHHARLRALSTLHRGQRLPPLRHQHLPEIDEGNNNDFSAN
ncbi:hypothetical protein [Streptomyces sp. NBC_01538]|uniref:hypothetical protein n=1 Tax=Streptomyces sp. NBC_01538 TaxID=2903897 RepID=UPI00386D2AB2